MDTALGRQHAERGFAIVRPAIEATLAAGLSPRRDMAVVIAATDMANTPLAGAAFKERCYLVAEIGDLTNSSYPNLDIALRKAELSARTGRPTANLAPHYLLEGDTVFWGSAVLDGIVVACAGLEEHHDEMFSYWIAASVQSAAREWFARRLIERPDDNFV